MDLRKTTILAFVNAFITSIPVLIFTACPVTF